MEVPLYTNPKIEVAKNNREEINAIVNTNYFLRIPTEDNRWTDLEIEQREKRLERERKWCRYSNNCNRLQCSYRHPPLRAKLCKDFRWCVDPKCNLIHPTQKFIDYLDYTPRDYLLKQGFFWDNTSE